MNLQNSPKMFDKYYEAFEAESAYEIKYRKKEAGEYILQVKTHTLV